MYMMENRIQSLGSSLLSLKNITQLHLYNNQIYKMDGFQNLHNLERLYLERNRIQKLEGLQNCGKLHELNLSN
jgi:Leucine-rich repeat (LRR) protein